MGKNYRFQPNQALPAYAFQPGVHPHPNSDSGHSAGVAEPQAELISTVSPGQNPVLRFALDLFNHAYYWESHVYFEALWNAHERSGPVADFLKLMIKLGAAGVKRTQGQSAQAQVHLERAKQILISLRRVQGSSILGFDLDQLQKQIETALGTQESLFTVYPDWT